MNGISVLAKETPGAPSLGHNEKAVYHTEFAGALILVFPASRTGKNKVKHLVRSVFVPKPLLTGLAPSSL